MLFRLKKYSLSALFFLLSAAFFVVVAPSADAYTCPPANIPTPGSSYGKEPAGELNNCEWNNLESDFVKTWGTTRMVGGLGIGIDAQPTDIHGILASSTIKANGGFMGSLNANYVSMGSFGTLTGGGNYSFPAGLNITGSVGIGTTTPIGKLEVAGSAFASFFSIPNANGTALTYTNGFADLYSGTGATLSYYNGSAVTPGLTMKLGNVGVGTEAPGNKLEINKNDGVVSGEHWLANLGRTAGSGLYIGYRADGAAVSGAIVRASDSIPLFLGTTGATQALTILNAGNVGIATTIPQAKLHVNGSVYFAGGSGDVNSSNGLSSLDSLFITNFFQNATTFTELNYSQGNVTGSGIITTFDRDLIFQAVSGLDLTANKINVKKAIGKAIYPKIPVGWGNDWNLIDYGLGYLSATTEIMTLKSNGNVGIGTTSPISTLDVNGLIKMRNYTITQPEDVVNKSYLDSSLASTSATIISQMATSSLWQGSLTGNIYNGNTGNVGIGLNNPGAKLDILDNNPGGTTGRNDWARLGRIVAGAVYNGYGVLGEGFSIDGSTYKYRYSDTAAKIDFTLGNIVFSGAPAGVAGNAITWSNNLVIKQAGNIGIGAATPNARLHIMDSSGNGPATSGATAIGGLRLNYSSAISLDFGVQGNANPVYSWLQSRNVSDYSTNYNLVFNPNGGNVGIGTTSPAYNLEVAGTGSFNQPVLVGAPNSALAAATKSYVDSSISAVPTGGGVYVTSTAATLGDNSPAVGTKGYTAANNLCNTAVTGSHVCLASEMLNTIAKNGTIPNFDVWILNGPPGYTAAANDCDGRTSAQYSNLGAYWQAPSANYLTGRGLLYHCSDTAIRIACCK